MLRVGIAVALVMAGAGFAMAEDGTKVIGSWIVTVKEDRFGEGGSFIAMTPDDQRDALGIRCIEKDLSIGLLNMNTDPKPLRVGDEYLVKLRVDQEPVMTTTGRVINARLIQVGTQADMVRAIRKGKETAVRIENERGVSSTMIFKTRENARALSRVASECKLD